MLKFTRPLSKLLSSSKENTKQQIKENNVLFSKQNEEIDNKLKALEALIASQNQMIIDLSLKTDFIPPSPLKDGMSFEQWTGILLACVAVIVTTIGVMIALMGFLGYKEALRVSKEVSIELVLKN